MLPLTSTSASATLPASQCSRYWISVPVEASLKKMPHIEKRNVVCYLLKATSRHSVSLSSTRE